MGVDVGTGVGVDVGEGVGVGVFVGLGVGVDVGIGELITIDLFANKFLPSHTFKSGKDPAFPVSLTRNVALTDEFRFKPATQTNDQALESRFVLNPPAFETPLADTTVDFGKEISHFTRPAFFVEAVMVTEMVSPGLAVLGAEIENEGPATAASEARAAAGTNWPKAMTTTIKTTRYFFITPPTQIRMNCQLTTNYSLNDNTYHAQSQVI